MGSSGFYGAFAMLVALLTAAIAAGPTASAAEPAPDGALPDGFVGEVVEPGVIRIVSDGAGNRFLPSGTVPHRIERHRIVAGHDGTIWVFGPRRFHRLGDPTRHRYWQVSRQGSGHPIGYPSDVLIAPNGRIWAPGAAFGGDDVEGALRVYDGERWRVLRRPGEIMTIERDGSGVMWVAATDTDSLRTVVHRRDEDGWTAIRPPTRDGSTLGPFGKPAKTYRFGTNMLDLAPDEAGGFWLGGYWDYSPGGRDHDRIQGLLHFDGRDWRTWEFEMYNEDEPPVFDTAIDGVPYVGSARFVDGRWEAVDVLADVAWTCGLFCIDIEASPDGRLWGLGAPDVALPDDQRWASCGGLISFDGEEATRYLSDLCVSTFDIGPDGRVWLLAGPRPAQLPERRPNGSWFTDFSVDAYVIDPDSGAASASAAGTDDDALTTVGVGDGA